MIEYIFTMDDGNEFVFEIELERPLVKSEVTQQHPQWTMLEFHKCKNCPLKVENYPNCPTAVDVEWIVTRFQAIMSYEKTSVLVKTPLRDYSKYCDAQTGLSSLLGLVMATSACPILSQLKGMAYYHLPFASPEETLFRTVGAHLIKQYYIYRQGERPDIGLTKLAELYEELEVLNSSFTERIRAASVEDANMNALIILFYTSKIVSLSLDEKLEILKPFFLPV